MTDTGKHTPELPDNEVPAQPEQSAIQYYEAHYKSFDDGHIDPEDMCEFAEAYAAAKVAEATAQLREALALGCDVIVGLSQYLTPDQRRAYTVMHTALSGAPSTQKFPSVLAESTKGPAFGVAPGHDPGTKAGSLSGPKEQK